MSNTTGAAIVLILIMVVIISGLVWVNKDKDDN